MSKFKLLLLSVALVLFVFGCGGGGGGSSSSTPDLQNMDVKIYGTYGSAGKFYAESASVGMWALNTTADEYALTGKVTDGDVTFNLTGVYNSVTKTYSLSAASSLFVYQIRGNIDAEGKMSDGEVSIKANNGGTWTVKATYPATVEATAPEITSPVDDQEAGLPTKWLGIWYGNFYGDEFYVSVTPWSITSYWDDGGGKWYSDPTAGDYMDIVKITWITGDTEADILTLGGWPLNSNAFDPNAFVKFSAKESSATLVQIGTYGDPVTEEHAYATEVGIPSTFAYEYPISRER